MNLMKLLAVGSLMGLLAPLLSRVMAGSSSTLAWLVDLAGHWQWLFLLVLVCSTLWVAVCASRRWVLVLCAAPLPWLTASEQAPTAERGGDVLVVAGANVNLGNDDPRPLVEWLAAEQVDIVALFEVSAAYAGRLDTSAEYPFQQVVPRRDPFGVALLSRHPLLGAQLTYDQDGIAQIEARVRWRGEFIDIVAMHPMPPLSPLFHAIRDKKLRAAADAAAASRSPTVLIGDLNATPWSSAFSGLADRGLRRATGLKPSWPAVASGMMGIPIDHVLVTPHWSLVDSRQGPSLGSDHLPTLARLMLGTDANGTRSR